MVSDARHAIKWLIRSPGFTAVAVLSLAIGIAFNTTVFAVVDALLLRPLPVFRHDRLVDVYTRGGDGDKYATSSYPDYLDFRAKNTVFSDMVGYSPSIAAVKAGDRSRMALGEVVTGNYFQVLGVGALIGRTLLPDDDRPGAPRAAMISSRLWQREYGADPGVLSRTILIHGQPYAIVGVAAVGRRRREIGIRMAVGAAPADVLGMVTRQGLGIAGVGIAAGLILAAIGARAIAGGLYGIGAWDPAAWGSAVGVLVSSAAFANYLPARRAARVSPSTALRTS